MRSRKPLNRETVNLRDGGRCFIVEGGGGGGLNYEYIMIGGGGCPRSADSTPLLSLVPPPLNLILVTKWHTYALYCHVMVA